MKEMGCSLSEIAQELGFENVEGVVTCLSEKYKQEAAWLNEEARGTLLAVQLGRYEAIIRGSYASALLGDPKSADIVMKAMAEENKLTRLLETDSSQTAQVLVVGGLEQDYIAALREAS
jgi:hypothetical protein